MRHVKYPFQKVTLFLFVLFLSSYSVFSQEFFLRLDNPQADHKEIIKEAEAYFAQHGKGKGSGWKQYSRWLYELQFHIDENGNRLNETSFVPVNKRERKLSRGISSTPSATWEELGPDYFDNTTSYNAGIGRINDIQKSSTNPNLIYAASAGGGVWKSVDAGTSWSPVTDDVGLPTDGYGLYSIALDPKDDQHLIVHMTGRGFLESTNGGDSWEKINSDVDFIAVRTITFHPDDSNVLFYGTDGGSLYKSTNTGRTWERKSLPDAFRRVESVVFKPGDANTVYVNADAFYKSTDGGETFRRINSGVKSEASHRSKTAVTPANPEVVYVVQSANTRFDALYKSTNSGETFTKVIEYTFGGNKNFFARANNASGDGGLGWYAMAIAVSKTNENDVSIGCINVWRSLNGGENFTIQSEHRLPTNIGFTHADIHHLSYDENNTIWCGSDGGVYTKSVGEDQWTNLSNTMGIRQVYKLAVAEQDAKIVAIGSQDNGHTVHNDEGIWVDWIGADGMEVNISPFNKKNMYAFTQNAPYLHTTIDGGNSRGGQAKPEGELGDWVTPMELSYQEEDVLFAAYTNVYRREGRDWIKLTDFGLSSVEIEDLAIAPSNDEVIYFIKGKTLYKTENGGQTWTQPLGTRSVNQVKIHPTNASVVAVVPSGNSSDVLLYSKDGFNNYETLGKGSDLGYTRAFTFDYSSLNGIYVATSRGEIYYTSEELSAWELYNDGLPIVAVNDMKVHRTTGEVFLGTFGRGVWLSEGYATQLVKDLNVSIDFVNPLVGTTKKDMNAINFLVAVNDKESVDKVTKVVFELNGEVIEDTEAPYNLVFAPSENGEYTVLAKAFSDDKLLTETVSRSVTVNEVVVPACSANPWEPKVYPTKGTLVSYENKIYSSKYYAKPQHVPGQEQYGPWIYEEDCAGELPANEAPKVEITSPFNNTIVSGEKVAFTVNATDAEQKLKEVKFFIDNEVYVVSQAPYALNWSVPESGNFTASALAIDDQGTESNLFTVSFKTGEQVPNEIPTIVLSPSDGIVYDLFTAILIETEVMDLDGEVTRVEFKIGEETLTDTEAPFEWLWMPAKRGPYTINATAFDDKGAPSITSVSNVVFRARPTISSFFPVDGTTINAGETINLSVIAEDLDGFIDRTIYFVNDEIYQTVYTGDNFATSWTPTNPGTYKLTAHAIDNESRGSSKVDSYVTVEAPNLAPVIESISPEDNSVIVGLAPIELIVTASDSDGEIASVVYSTNGGNFPFEKNGSMYSYRYNPGIEGAKFISIVVTDNRGKQAYGNINLTFEKEEVETSCTEPQWEENTAYASAGNKVTYSGNIYENKWYTKGDIPSNGGPWRLIDNCDGSTIDCSSAVNWSEGFAYSTSGTPVKYQGKLYTNEYYTKGDAPSTADVWQLQGICSESTAKRGNISIEDFVGIYPNPSSGVVELSYLRNDSEAVYLDVFTSAGYLVMGKIYSGGGKQTIDLRAQPAGSYVFVFRTADQVLRQTVQIVE